MRGRGDDGVEEEGKEEEDGQRIMQIRMSLESEVAAYGTLEYMNA